MSPPTDWSGRPVVVAGAGLSGAAAARALRERGARVLVAEADEQRAEPLRAEGLTVHDLAEPPPGTALVVTSPGWRPTSPLLVAAAAAGVEVVGEVELAWRLRRSGAPAWLTLTGTNGKTTTVRMLEAVLRAAGHRTVAAGNVGLPLVEAADGPYDVLAVELSSFQLHGSSSLRPHAGALLNLADDHTDWHGSAAAYAAAKARVWSGATSIGNVDDPQVRDLLASAPGRQVGVTLHVPRAGEVGLVEDLLVDRAFRAPGDVAGEATELASLGDLTVPGGHNVANALVAAALARAYDVPAAAVREGLAAVRPEPHRNERVAVTGGPAGSGGAAGTAGIVWVDDSKATNPHAAAASLAGYDPVVWVAGGLLKGADVDALVRGAAPRLAAVVLLGTDRAVLADALRRHAPDVPVVEVARLDTGAMSEVVDAAALLARPGDTVLLAPAAASMDCFRDYAQRGELFSEFARARARAGAVPA